MTKAICSELLKSARSGAVTIEGHVDLFRYSRPVKVVYKVVSYLGYKDMFGKKIVHANLGYQTIEEDVVKMRMNRSGFITKVV